MYIKLFSQAQKLWTPFQYVLWSDCVRRTKKMKLQVRHAVLDRGIGWGRWNKKRLLLTNSSMKRSKNTAPTQNTYVYIPGHKVSGTIPSTQHRSCRGNKRGPQQATTAKRKGAATRVAEFTAVPPLPPIDIDNQQHCCLLLFAEALWVVAVYCNCTTTTAPTVVPNLRCVPNCSN